MMLLDDFLDYFNIWQAFWFLFGYLEYELWLHLIKLVRRKRVPLYTTIFIFAILLFLMFVEFITYTQFLRVSPRSDFGFWWSIFFPTVAHYIFLGYLIYGVYRSFRHKFLRLKSFRVFKKYHKYVPLIELTYAFAYSSYLGIAASCINYGVTYYVDRTIQVSKKVKKSRKEV